MGQRSKVYRPLSPSILHHPLARHVYARCLLEPLHLPPHYAYSYSLRLPATIHWFSAQWSHCLPLASTVATSADNCHRDWHPKHRAANYPHEVFVASTGSRLVCCGACCYCHVYAVAIVDCCDDRGNTPAVLPPQVESRPGRSCGHRWNC